MVWRQDLGDNRERERAISAATAVKQNGRNPRMGAWGFIQGLFGALHSTQPGSAHVLVWSPAPMPWPGSACAKAPPQAACAGT
jgi:hypothetical protein